MCQVAVALKRARMAATKKALPSKPQPAPFLLSLAILLRLSQQSRRSRSLARLPPRGLLGLLLDVILPPGVERHTLPNLHEGPRQLVQSVLMLAPLHLKGQIRPKQAGLTVQFYADGPSGPNSQATARAIKSL